MPLRARASAAAFALALPFALGDAARAEPAPAKPIPSIPKRVVVDPCSAAGLEAAVAVAVATVPPTDPASRRAEVARAAFMGRLATCVPPLLDWAKTSTSGPTSWARARGELATYFFALWHDGALLGSKPEEAYFVKCDATTMTQNEIDLGLLVCVYGVAPFKPAEFESGSVRVQTTGKQTR
jgi:hypothetical protein